MREVELICRVVDEVVGEVVSESSPDGGVVKVGGIWSARDCSSMRSEASTAPSRTSSILALFSSPLRVVSRSVSITMSVGVAAGASLIDRSVKYFSTMSSMRLYVATVSASLDVSIWNELSRESGCAAISSLSDTVLSCWARMLRAMWDSENGRFREGRMGLL